MVPANAGSPPRQLSPCRSPCPSRGLMTSRWAVSLENQHFWPHVLPTAAAARGAAANHPAHARSLQGAALRSAAKTGRFCRCSEQTLLFLVSRGKGSSRPQLLPHFLFPPRIITSAAASAAESVPTPTQPPVSRIGAGSAGVTAPAGSLLWQQGESSAVGTTKIVCQPGDRGAGLGFIPAFLTGAAPCQGPCRHRPNTQRSSERACGLSASSVCP